MSKFLAKKKDSHQEKKQNEGQKGRNCWQWAWGLST